MGFLLVLRESQQVPQTKGFPPPFLGSPDGPSMVPELQFGAARRMIPNPKIRNLKMPNPKIPKPKDPKPKDSKLKDPKSNDPKSQDPKAQRSQTKKSQTQRSQTQRSQTQRSQTKRSRTQRSHFHGSQMRRHSWLGSRWVNLHIWRICAVSTSPRAEGHHSYDW